MAEAMTWSEVDVEGTAPSPRAHHTCTAWGNKLVFFGGYGGHAGSRTFFGDLFVLTLNNAGGGILLGFDIVLLGSIFFFQRRKTHGS